MSDPSHNESVPGQPFARRVSRSLDHVQARSAQSLPRTRIPVRLPDPDSITMAGSEQLGRANEVHDDQIAASVHERLTALGTRITGRIVIRVHKGTIILQGAVRTPQERLVLLSCVQQLRPDSPIRDRLEVVPPDEDSATDATSSSFAKLALKSMSAVSVGLLSVVLLSVVLRDKGPNHELVEIPVVVQAGGSPAAGAFLTLHPSPNRATDPSANATTSLRPQGRVTDNGRVRWTTYQPGDGLPRGEYVVTATWSRPVNINGEQQPGPNLLPPIYEAAATSPLRLLVSSAMPHHESIVFDFK